MKKFLLSIWILVFFLSCGTKQNDTSVKVVYHKKFGVMDIFLCYAKDTNWIELEKECSGLIQNTAFGFVYCYDDSSKIKNLNDFPEDKLDYFLEVIKRDKDPIEYNRVAENYKKIEEIGDTSKVKFVLLDKKEVKCWGNKNAICRWYVFFVENYYDNKEVCEKMKIESKKLPLDRNGATQVYFFKDKMNVPKLENDGGWGPKTSANSMDREYGKYLVGHVERGGTLDDFFSKGF